MSKIDVTQPLPVHQAKQLIRKSLGEHGSIELGHPHLRERMQKHNMFTPDIQAVLRGGAVQPPEFENGAWRYQVCTKRMVVVVEFESPTEVFVVTCWRITS